jgi:hypothetical protein
VSRKISENTNGILLYNVCNAFGQKGRDYYPNSPNYFYKGGQSHWV